jgi:hypothetical protein
MNETEHLKQIIRLHTGRENAIKIKTLGIIIGVSDERNVRRMIERLVEQEEFPVCHETEHEPKGVYFPANKAEAEAEQIKLREQGIAVIARGTRLPEMTVNYYAEESQKGKQAEMVLL